MRYLPHTQKEIDEMLKVVGASSINELFSGVPSGLKLKKPLNLPKAMTEIELLDHLTKLSKKK